MDMSPKLSPSRLWHRGVLAFGFVVVACFYAWTNGPTAASWRIHGPQSDYYNVLIHGFLKGHLYMDVPVAPELKACPNPWDPTVRGPNVPILQDATYYNGRYYLYYGVAPLTLMLPFRLITGADMPLSLAAVCFACGGLLVSLILWESIRRRYFPDVRAWVGLAAVLILGVASPMPVLLRRTLVYELPIASGCFFSLAALLTLYWSVHSRRARIGWLVVASVCLGLAVASRLTFLFTMPILLIPVWIAWRERDRRDFSTLPWRALAAAILPIASIGALMALYNYERFGRLTEFGTKYQVAEMFNLMTPRRFAADFVPFNTVDYLLARPDLSRHFPFFYFPGAWHSPVNPPADYWGPELVPGLLTCFPICWLAALSCFAGAGADRPRNPVRPWLLAPWGLFAATFLCLLCYYAGAVRYMVDFTPSLMLCTAIGLLVLESWLLRKGAAAVKVIGRTTWLALLTASVLVAVMFSLGVRATFRAVDPVGHARVARFFERLAFWNPRLPNEGGPVEVALRLDRLGTNESEPLLACGAGDFSERVFLRRPDGDHVVVGYRHGLNGQPQLSAPIAIKAGDMHRLYFDLGSLYPGSTDPVATDGGGTARNEKLNQRWLILFDGEIVLQGRYNDHERRPAGDLVFLGCDPNTDDFGKILLTPIVSVRRLSLAEAAARAANRSSASLEFKAPRDMAHGSQTLFAIVGPGVDVRAEIEYLSAERAALRFWSDGRQVGGDTLFSNNGQWHRLELDQIYDTGKNSIQVRMDGAPIAAIAGGQANLRRDEFRPGWGAAATTAFTGLIRNAASDSVQPLRPPPRGSRTILSVIFPRVRKNGSEPLLVTGRNGAGDLYEVVFLDPDRVCFRQDHWGAGIVRTSRPIEVSASVAHRIVFDFRPTNPGATQPGGRMTGVMSLTLDGQTVWEKDAPCIPFKEDEIYVGANPIGGSTCSQEFTGDIVSCDTTGESDSARPE